MKVLQVLGRSAGGIARHVAYLATHLEEVGEISVGVAAPPDTPEPIPRRTGSVTVPDGLLGHGAATRRLRELIEEGGFDVVHAHGLRAGIDSARAARRLGIPAIATVHNLVRPEIAGPMRARIQGWAEPLVVRLNDRTLAVSEDIATRLRSRAGTAAPRVETLYLGIGDAPAVSRSAREVRAELGVPEGATLIVTIGRLAPQKALHVMIDALAVLPANVFLAILGEGPLENSLKARAASVGVGERIAFLGYRPDAADHLAAADLFCMSSVWEGIPLAAQEAILLGIPVVATDVGGMPELVSDGVSGRLVPPGDPAALVRAISDVLDRPEAARGMSERALTDLRRDFSAEAMLKRLHDIYEEVAGAARG